MVNSRQQFGVNGVKNLTNSFISYTEDMTKIAEMVYGVTDEVTSLGEVEYHKTLFRNTATGESCYLLDQLMEIESHTRITENSLDRILEETADL